MQPELSLQIGPVGNVRDYLQIPAAFHSQVVFDVQERSEGYDLLERPVALFHKDYDAVESPLRWPELFDVSKWIQTIAYWGDRRIGGAIGAMDTPGVDMLEGRRDLVVLWDLRVAQDARNSGVGAALFQAVERWGRTQGCVELKVETQNVNVAACRLYRGQGCSVAQVNRGAYPDLPGEVQLIWRKRLA